MTDDPARAAPAEHEATGPMTAIPAPGAAAPPGAGRISVVQDVLTGRASKFLVAVLTTVAVALPVYFGTAKWEPVVISVVGAILVYLVPNAPKPAPPASIARPWQD